jgi:hypothetical protein
MTNKTKKQVVSLFGINDCHKPKKNTKKNYEYRMRTIYKRPKTLKNYSKKIIKNIILFPHDLGQTKHGVDKAPKYLQKFINIDRNLDLFEYNKFKLLKELSNVLFLPNCVSIMPPHSIAFFNIVYSSKYFRAR